MSTDEFITRLSHKGYTRTDSRQIVHDLITTITECLVDGEEVMFYGFGKFVVNDVQPRESVNVSTQERFVIPGHRTPKFYFGKALKASITEGKCLL